MRTNRYEHSFFDEFLLRVAAYYKDISNQAKTVNYYGRNSLVNYTQRTSNQYQDFRGFEVQLNKNRGNWVQGFINFTYDVRTTGYFGLGSYFESAVDQRAYERSNGSGETHTSAICARKHRLLHTSNYGRNRSLSLLGDWPELSLWQAGVCDVGGAAHPV